MSESLRKNYIYNLINTVSQIVFPLITFPYASRVMMPEGIGQVQFFSAIIGYITLFTSLGIPIYAIKEVAAVRNDPEKLKRVTLEILSLSLFLTIIGYFAVFILCGTVTKIQEDLPLFLILSTSIIFTTIGCDWFYRGVEDFRYITILGLIIKVVSALLLFCLVKSKDDILLYALYTIIGTIGGNLFNLFRLRKYITFKINLRELHPFRHIKPVLHVFIFSAITSIYIELNTVILGFMKDSSDVGIYSVALRIFGLINGVVASLSTVMLPRISNLLSYGNMQEVKRLAQKAYDFSFLLALPVMAGLIICSPYVVRVLCGEEFMAAVDCVKLMAPIMLFLSVSSLLGYQILYPMGHLNIVIGYCAVGCLIDVVLNFVLIPSLSYLGVSISYMSTELIVAIIAIIASRKYIKVNFFTNSEKKALISTIIMTLILLYLDRLQIDNSLIKLIIMGLIGAMSYALSLYLLKESLLLEYIPSFIKRK